MIAMPTPFQLAQVNIARMKGGPNDPVMAGIFSRLDEINRLAENSPGYIWRLPGNEAAPERLRALENHFVPFEPERLFYNLSVWESPAQLRDYAFATAHAEMLRAKNDWIARFEGAHLALWWVPAGHRPTIVDSAARLRAVQERGSSPYAFTFKQLFPAPADVVIRQARADNSIVIAEILGEAARWLEQSGQLMWRADELKPEHIAADVGAGLFYLAEISGAAAGVVKFQLEDSLFWPDLPQSDAAYVHRLAVRRRYASQGVSTALLQWAADRARSLGRRWLRLDCEASRLRLRAVYERFGFHHHSDRQVGPYYVSRYEFDLGN